MIPSYPTLAELERLFLSAIRFRSPTTANTYRGGLKRFHHFLTSAGVDPFVETAEVLPDDILEHFFN